MIDTFPIRRSVAIFVVATVVGFLATVGGLWFLLVPVCVAVVLYVFIAMWRDAEDAPGGGGPYGDWPMAEIKPAPPDFVALPGDGIHSSNGPAIPD